MKGDETLICLSCEAELNFRIPHNQLHDIGELFWGKSDVDLAYALHEYRLGSKLQQLLHALKYEGDRQLTSLFGNELSFVIKEHEEFNNFDYLSFPPSSKKNRRLRGFNQAEEICKIVSTNTSTPTIDLFKNKGKKQSQTQQDVHDRHLFLRSAFELRKNKNLQLEGSKILLIDDVVTTGATLSECSNLLEKAGVANISVLALAFRPR